MYRIINKQILASDIKRIDVEAPLIVNKVLPGQFVIVIPEEKGSWIPLSVIDADKRKNTITLIFKESGEATFHLGMMPIGDTIFSILGPLGNPATIEKYGVVVCAASGVAIASILPVCRALKEAGNKVLGVIGAKTKREIFLEAQMRLACNQLFLATEDASYARKGKVSKVVEELLGKEQVDMVYAIGPVDMMKTISQLTKEENIKTRIQVYSNIHCGMGLCGSCRSKVEKKEVLSCLHGPEFDGHKVDFDYLKVRMNAAAKCRQPKDISVARALQEPGGLVKMISGIFKET
ncbi:MAG: sulfide/dihydroorotate dehydrogenase-like FAD/NAD-binding protein [Candidatus Omnitrophica bacterium]|nr:sulfide/dihydroorotate dehydrogenase-like FAD/NAD-binding protein [Candidatus Omnitrophota bacterium]